MFTPATGEWQDLFSHSSQGVLVPTGHMWKASLYYPDYYRLVKKQKLGQEGLEVGRESCPDGLSPGAAPCLRAAVESSLRETVAWQVEGR